MISSVIYGQNIEKNLAMGAAIGAISAAVLAAAVSHAQSVTKELNRDYMDGPLETSYITYKLEGKFFTREKWLMHTKDSVDFFGAIIQSGEKISILEYWGHGSERGDGLVFGEGGLFTGSRNVVLKGEVLDYSKVPIVGLDELPYDIADAFTSNALIELECCNSAKGTGSIAAAFKAKIPDAKVYGFTGKCKWAFPLREMHSKWNKNSEWVEVK